MAKWTRGLDIFDHDYVVVPINEACHWYLVIICNLPNLNRHPPPLDGDPTSPSSDKIDPALRNDGEGRPNLSRACSPSLDEAETPKEKDARTSFAELSLEHSQEKTKVIQGLGDASDVKPNADDQEMLDTQLKEDIADAAEQTAPRADGNSTLHASAKKKGKRKSLPPGRKLDPGQPAIVTFDSLTGTHPSTVRVIKDYLIAEAADKRGGMKFDEKQIKGMNAIGIPKQDNYCDCGPFLLGYMAKFVEDPKGFMSKAMQKQFDVDKDWPTLVPSKLRANIRDLMFQLYREQEDDKRESAKKTGKYIPSVAKKAEPSPTGGAPQTQPVEDPSTKTAREATKQVSRSTSPSPATRKEALENAIPIDAADVPKARTSVTDSPKATRQDPTLGKEQSFIVIDSQSQPHSRPGDEPSPVHPADELPSTIEDSQPVDSLQALEDSMAGTPPQSHYEGPPEPASSPLEAKGVSSPTWSPDADRTLRSSPRSSTKKARKKEKTNKREVVELD